MTRFGWLRRSAGKVPDPARPYSLRRRLLVSLLGASALLWLVSLGIMVHIAWDETSEVFDDGLEDTAYLIRAASAGLPQPGAPIADPIDRADHRAGLYYQIVAEGRVLRRVGAAPEQPFMTGFDKRKGFRTVLIGVVPWRVFVLRSPDHGFEVQVGQPLEARTEIFEELAENLTWPALGLLTLLGVVIWLAVGRLLRPIELTALAIARKTPEDLAPVQTTDPPLELAPIIASLNTVFGRLDKALQAERRFTADAAHELRTPLAALRMKIQLLERQQPEHQSSLRKLYEDADRCTALVENLLALARLDAGREDALVREAVDLATLCDELHRSYAAQAEARQIDLQIDCRAAMLYGNAELLRVALRNLFDNVLRYCPPGSRVRIEARPGAQGVRLTVRDDGPGVPEPLRSQLARRFFRVLGSEQTGSGLGLSIVERIAALHGASLRFEEGLDRRGLGVILDFPPFQEAPPHVRNP